MGKYTETVEGMVKKYNESHAARNFFNSLFLLKAPEVLKKYPELREPHAFCIYCAKIAPEREFSELHATVLQPIEGGIKLRHGICKKCGANTSSKTK